MNKEFSQTDSISSKLFHGFDEQNQALIKESEKVTQLLYIMNRCTSDCKLRYNENGLKFDSGETKCFKDCITHYSENKHVDD